LAVGQKAHRLPGGEPLMARVAICAGGCAKPCPLRSELEVHQRFYSKQFDNGLVLVAEQMGGVRSAAFTILLPAGAAYDPDGREGLAAVLADMVFRGAGERDSRQVIVDLDNLGAQRVSSVESVHMVFGAATLSANLCPVLAIYADILRRPWLPQDEFEPARSLCLQELEALEDEPRQKLLVELRRRHYPYPLGRPTVGTLEGLQALHYDELCQHYRASFRPNGTIIGVAGDVNWSELVGWVGRLFGDWQPQERKLPPSRPPGPKRDHICHQTHQTQIGIAYRTVPYRHEEYLLAQASVSVLSGGSSARLFTEVRERRGLCYAIFASYHSSKDEGAVVCYAGTTTERARETLEVTLNELVRLPKGIDEDEVARVQAGLKSSLIMQGESTAARATAVAADWFHLQRVRSFDEIRAGIERLNAAAITEHLQRHPPADFTILTLGPEPIA
jgi:predicted Zn-dependent peptidase